MKTEEDVMSSATPRNPMLARNQRKKAVRRLQQQQQRGQRPDAAGTQSIMPTTPPTTSPYYDDASRPISSHPQSPDLVTAQHPVSLSSCSSVSSQTSVDHFGWAPQPSTPYLSSYDVSSGDPQMQSQVCSYCLVAPLQELGYEWLLGVPCV